MEGLLEGLITLSGCVVILLLSQKCIARHTVLHDRDDIYDHVSVV